MLALLLPAAKLDKTVDCIEQAAAPRLACPDCGSRHLHRHGRAHGLQRYRCKECGRTCNALSGTTLARLLMSALIGQALFGSTVTGDATHERSVSIRLQSTNTVLLR